MKSKKKPLGSHAYWICDSMDGAVQIIQHLPGWTINLVLMQGGEPVFAVIYDPYAKEIFHAIAMEGAYLNDERIKVSKKSDLKLALASFGHPPILTKMPKVASRLAKKFEIALVQFGAVRNYGPSALQIASVGASRIDLFFEEGLDTYNWIAGILIAKEAGAEILNMQGEVWRWGDESLFVTTRELLAVSGFFIK